MKTGILLLLFIFLTAGVSRAGDILEEWGKVNPPAAPQAEAVHADPSVTALLVLDMEERTCSPERRPRCISTLPAVERLMAHARRHGVPVLHSTTSRSAPENILPQVKPLEGETVVKSGANKFFMTELFDALQEKHVKTVIIVGTAAHGAVLHTAAGAAMHGFRVIIPADGLSAEDLYTEQASLMLMLTGPATKNAVTLTKTDLINF